MDSFPQAQEPGLAAVIERFLDLAYQPAEGEVFRRGLEFLRLLDSAVTPAVEDPARAADSMLETARGFLRLGGGNPSLPLEAEALYHASLGLQRLASGAPPENPLLWEALRLASEAGRAVPEESEFLYQWSRSSALAALTGPALERLEQACALNRFLAERAWRDPAFAPLRPALLSALACLARRTRMSADAALQEAWDELEDPARPMPGDARRLAESLLVHAQRGLVAPGYPGHVMSAQLARIAEKVIRLPHARKDPAEPRQPHLNWPLALLILLLAVLLLEFR